MYIAQTHLFSPFTHTSLFLLHSLFWVGELLETQLDSTPRRARGRDVISGLGWRHFADATCSIILEIKHTELKSGKEVFYDLHILKYVNKLENCKKYLSHWLNTEYLPTYFQNNYYFASLMPIQ